jgi:hypothetical protein
MLWESLEPLGFPGYEIDRAGNVRHEGALRQPNQLGAVVLVDAEDVRRCRSVGKLVREVFGADAPGATPDPAKLDEGKVREILTSDESNVVLAARLGVSVSTIKAARARQTWGGVKVRRRARHKTDAESLRAA